jgi:hypothetical protein
MLMRFGVSNYRSILEYQELSLVASALKDPGADLISNADIREHLLPSVLIYGANASGKSNVLAAISFMRAAVLNSHKSQSPNSKIPRHPFLLRPGCREKPTRLDCDFIVDGVRYNFGFTASDEAFEEEWLFAFPGGNRRKWYYRKRGEKISFGKHFKGKNHSIAALTRPNVLFLSSAAQNAHEQATHVFNYFEKSWRLIVSPALDMARLAEDLSGGVEERIITFLRHADTGIKSARVNESAAPEELARLLERFKDVADAEFPNFKVNPAKAKSELSLAHYGGEHGSEEVFLDISLESRGTLRLLKLLQPVLHALDTGGLVLVDEIDSSIHALLSRKILNLFSAKDANKHGAQIIATTHDTTLLCADFLRRDQIWFTEKDRTGTTHLFPLTDIKTRNTDNFEKGYLQGRFGAVPFLGPIEDLLAERV